MTGQPNILLVAFDSLSAEGLELHFDALPTLRALSANSLNFTNAYASCPESSPARASLFTGLDMAAHGLWTDGVALPKREVPLPEVFAQHGYESWLVGRRQLAGVSNWTTEHARPNEYHHFDWAHGPLHRSRQNAYLTWLLDAAPDAYAAIFPRQADPDDTTIPPSQRDAMAALPDNLSFNAWAGQQAISRIGTKPFFAVVGFVVGGMMGAHTICETLDMQALRQADAALGAIMNALPKNTCVVLTAGRGNIPNIATPDLLSEAAIKVPLMLALPDGERNGISECVSTIDLAPTLYALSGIRPPKRLQGQSLTSTAPRGWALSRLRHPDLPHQTALRTERWKLIVTHDAPGAACLYDLHTDPGETRNLASEQEHQDDLELVIDLMIDARVALEDRTEPRIAKF